MIQEINPLKVYESYINDYETKNGKACPLPRKVTAEEVRNLLTFFLTRFQGSR